MTFRQTIRWTVFLDGISLLPMLIDRICHLDQPRPVFDQFQQFYKKVKVKLLNTCTAMRRSIKLHCMNERLFL